MKTAILGTGRLAAALSTLMLQLNHSVRIGSRKAERANQFCALFEGRISGGEQATAVADADIVYLATQWQALPAFLQQIDWQGRVVCDCTNPEPPEGYGLEVGHTDSGLEILAQSMKGASIVKTFNYVYAEVIEKGGWFQGRKSSLLMCGHDPAKALLQNVLAGSGFVAVDAGDIQVARYLEPLAALAVQLARVQKWGPGTFVFNVDRQAP